MYPSCYIQDHMSRTTARVLFDHIAAQSEHLSPRAVDKPLVLYGAGNLGRMARAYFDFLEIPVDIAVDVNAPRLREDPFWSGVRLMVPDEVPVDLRRNALLAVCVATSPYTPLAEQLAAVGWTDVLPFYDIAEAYRPRHPLSNGWFAEPFTAKDEANIATVLDGWADDMSRAHHLQFLAWRRLRQEWHFSGAPVTTGDRYFIPEVLSEIGSHPRVLDVGAHHGEVAQHFVEMWSGFGRLWMIEPDVDSLDCIRRWLATLDHGQRNRIRLLDRAIGSSAERRQFFSGLGYASQFSAEGNRLVETTTIDVLGVDPTYVKLHLEGWELDALMGAIETLKQHRPIIAATVYHNRLGLWETPLWLMRLFEGSAPEYRFYFRLHSWCGTGAVVYGVPAEHPASRFTASSDGRA